MKRSRLHSVAAVHPRAVRSLPAAIVAISMLLGANACRRPNAAEDLGTIHDLRPLIDKFSPVRPVVVVPDRFWETAADGGAWVFRGYANLVCFVDQPPDSDLGIALVPTEETAGFHFMMSWDGEELWPAPRRLADPVEALTISRDRLSRGLHRLEIRRVDVASYEVIVDTTIAGDSAQFIGIDPFAFTLTPEDTATITVGVSYPSTTVEDARALPVGETVWVATQRLGGRWIRAEVADHRGGWVILLCEETLLPGDSGSPVYAWVGSVERGSE